MAELLNTDLSSQGFYMTTEQVVAQHPKINAWEWRLEQYNWEEVRLCR